MSIIMVPITAGAVLRCLLLEGVQTSFNSDTSRLPMSVLTQIAGVAENSAMAKTWTVLHKETVRNQLAAVLSRLVGLSMML